MPRFSICVSSYNDAEYLPACLDSVLNQSFSNIELIVVDDGSPDNTAEILKAYSQRDSRVRPIIKTANEGVHLGRKAAVSAATSDYVIFLDSDDELRPGFLSGLDSVLAHCSAEIIHFGIDVINAGVTDDECEVFESYVNKTVDYLEGGEIIRAAYSKAAGYVQDWRVTQRVYCLNLAKRAFAEMTNDRLGRAQDGYETFVLLALANSQLTRNDIIGLDYYLGRGVNAASTLSPLDFKKSADGFWDAIVHFEEFAATHPNLNLNECVSGGRTKMLELLFNDWHVRVPGSDKIRAAKLAADVLGGLSVGIELMRLARDSAYAKWDKNYPFNQTDDYLIWYEAAKELAGNASATSSEFYEFYSAAKNHIADVRRRTLLNVYKDQPIRIFVSTHKSVELFDSNIMQPVQVGCINKSGNERFDWAFHDDEGENISSLNSMYCELTTQYWAWKNIDKAEYVGFCHYRRYFDFSDTRHTENIYGEIIDNRIDECTQQEYCLNDVFIARQVNGFDVITTPIEDVRDYMGSGATIRSQFDDAAHLFVEDLDRVITIMGEQHPEYIDDARSFLSGHVGCFCNMFIMRKQLFNNYCAWLFPILQEFCSRTDMSKYDREALRTPGHLSERLLNIYLLHQQRVHPELRVKHLQCVHFEDPDYRPHPQMLDFTGDLRPVIPLVFASDNAYVPMLTTTVYSALKNASTGYRYDVSILHRDISGDSQAVMRSFFSSFENATMRFIDVSDIIDTYKLTTNNPHISIETYYRFLIQKLLPFYDKVLYLDSDLIVKGNVAELFSFDLGDNLLGAVRDIDFLGNVNMKKGKRAAYAKCVLGMKDPYAYFQAGVLLLNTRAMRELHPIEQWLEYAANDRFIYNDQDVLNSHCEGRVAYLDYEWNVMINCAGRIENVFSFAPAEVFDAFLNSRGHEKIVHYAGVEKPWKTPECDRSQLYWSYARETPFYETLIRGITGGNVVPPLQSHERAISAESGLRRFLDPLVPVGSARREVAKSIVRIIRRRK